MTLKIMSNFPVLLPLLNPMLFMDVLVLGDMTFEFLSVYDLPDKCSILNENPQSASLMEIGFSMMRSIPSLLN